ncbi:MAG: dihydrodipicolinate synthase family protein [Pseudomonadota bacterium]
MTMYSGIWPVAPTPFNADGTLDRDGMRRVLDLMIDQGVDGICILANFSEQFLLSDMERDELMRLSLEHVDGRVPVIVTISHYSTDVVVARARLAKSVGASMVMMMPPYHGVLLRGTSDMTFQQFQAVSDVGLPIMVQDAPLSGVDLSVPFLARMAKEIEQVRLFKIECKHAANKIAALIDAGGEAVEGPFDGEEGITLFADLEAGATGSMTSAMMPDLIKPLISGHREGRRDEALALYNRLLPAISHENRQTGLRGAKAAMKAGGVIKSEHCRHPIPAMNDRIRGHLLELLRPLDPLVLRWAR